MSHNKINEFFVYNYVHNLLNREKSERIYLIIRNKRTGEKILISGKHIDDFKERLNYYDLIIDGDDSIIDTSYPEEIILYKPIYSENNEIKKGEMRARLSRKMTY